MEVGGGGNGEVGEISETFSDTAIKGILVINKVG